VSRQRETFSRHGRIVALATCVFSLFAVAPSAFAVPSFARQTGQSCGQCHTQAFGPALTEFGRQFKLNGYVLGNSDAIPLSAMVIASFTNTAQKLPEKAADHFDDNDNFALQEVGVFYAGKITDHIGTFTQVTYDGISRDTAWDNFDTRWATNTSFGAHAAVVGVSINNSPTVQDLWNSTPTWSFPYTGSDLAPSPGAAPLVVDGLGQQVLGATAYTMIDNHWYLEAGAYENLPNSWLDRLAGTSQDSPRAKNLMPYWRAAWQTTTGAHYFSLGTFGLSAELDPDSHASGTNKYTDVGFDGTYQYTDGGHEAINLNLSYVREDQDLDESYRAEEANGSAQHLDALRLDLGYVYEQTWSASVGLFDTRGERDTGLFTAEPVEGSAAGRPDSRGYTLQLEYMPWGKSDSWRKPWANTRVGVQYTGYDKFNGRDSNYDGFGRSAGDNDTLFLFLWTAV